VVHRDRYVARDVGSECPVAGGGYFTEAGNRWPRKVERSGFGLSNFPNLFYSNILPLLSSMLKGAAVSTRYTTFSHVFPQFPFGWAQNGNKKIIQ